MAASVRVLAPAKVNLHLRVYSRRADGYHGISSVFQAISLSDEIVVRSLKRPDIIEIDGDFDCPPEDTSLYKAIMAFRMATGDRSGLSVSVNKRVPAGAGLGGGSSDAAALLRALEALVGRELSPRARAQAALSVGSDVPFFLEGGAALVSGRGERLEALAGREDFELVILMPGFSVKTAQAYSLLDQLRPDDSAEPDPPPEVLKVAYGAEPATWPFANSFEPIMAAVHPQLAGLVQGLRGAGALFAAMSGSGSALFGVFPRGKAAQARTLLAARGHVCHIAVPLARLPGLG